ncbi:MAG: hypothetical protein MJ078_03160, partial [Clostridia bacterium]|nr:hypothetical protein [Clostridia bacterium]
FLTSSQGAGLVAVSPAAPYEMGNTYTVSLSDGVFFEGYADATRVITFSVRHTAENDFTEVLGSYTVHNPGSGTDEECEVTYISASGSSSASGGLSKALFESDAFLIQLSSAADVLNRYAANPGAKATLSFETKGNGYEAVLRKTGNNGEEYRVCFYAEVSASLSAKGRLSQTKTSRQIVNLSFDPLTFTNTYILKASATLNGADLPAFDEDFREALARGGKNVAREKEKLSAMLAQDVDFSKVSALPAAKITCSFGCVNLAYTPVYTVEDLVWNFSGHAVLEGTTVASYRAVIDKDGILTGTPETNLSLRLTEGNGYGNFSFTAKENGAVTLTSSSAFMGKTGMPQIKNGLSLNVSLKGLLQDASLAGTLNAEQSAVCEFTFGGSVRTGQRVLKSFVSPYTDVLLAYASNPTVLTVTEEGTSFDELLLGVAEIYSATEDAFTEKNLSAYLEGDPISTSLTVKEGVILPDAKAPAGDLGYIRVSLCHLPETWLSTLPDRLIMIKNRGGNSLDAYYDAYFAGKDTEAEKSFRALYRAGNDSINNLFAEMLQNNLESITAPKELEEIKNRLIMEYFNQLYSTIADYKSREDTVVREWECRFVEEARVYDTLTDMVSMLSKGQTFTEDMADSLINAALDSEVIFRTLKTLLEDEENNVAVTQLQSQYAKSDEDVKDEVKARLHTYMVQNDGNSARQNRIAYVYSFLGIEQE